MKGESERFKEGRKWGRKKVGRREGIEGEVRKCVGEKGKWA